MLKHTTISPTGWLDYQLLDSGNGQRLEQYGQFRLVRPDPTVTWKPRLPMQEWSSANAVFQRSDRDKGWWKTRQPLPEYWPVHWQDCTFLAHATPYKHTGIFPEQAAHWSWFRQLIEQRVAQQVAKEHAQPEQPRVLNLFAYTGAASIVAARAGAKVTHVDSSRPAIGWAKDNQVASGLDEFSIRWILDDVSKFVEREVRRCNRYEGIIMDPPAYGHGRDGERWDFRRSLIPLLRDCRLLMSDTPLFFLINAYAVNLQPQALQQVIADEMQFTGGQISSGELVLVEQPTVAPQTVGLLPDTQALTSNRNISTGVWCRWQ